MPRAEDTPSCTSITVIFRSIGNPAQWLSVWQACHYAVVVVAIGSQRCDSVHRQNQASTKVVSPLSAYVYLVLFSCTLNLVLFFRLQNVLNWYPDKSRKSRQYKI